MKFKTIGLSLIAITASFLAGFGWADVKKGKLPLSGAPWNDLMGKKQVGEPPNLTPTQVFKASFAQIQNSYYRKVEPKNLKYAGMAGMMAALGDPHTIFMEPTMASSFTKETKTGFDFVGVGARLAPDPAGAKVVTVFKSGPASKKGMKPGDMVIQVDGKSVKGLAVDGIVSKIRGKAGTNVKLTIMRGSSPTPISFTIARQKVIAPSADGVMLAGTKVGYLMLTAFAENTPGQFNTQLNDLEKAGMTSLIIDVRGNPGGLLEAARDMLSEFTANKTVVRMVSRDGDEQVVNTFTNRKRSKTYPIVVLMNEDSASAAEIFAGVLKDYKLATLVGDHSYGKASVQNLFMMRDGSSAKITIAHYFLPSTPDIGRKVDEDGQFISGGLKPDVSIPLSLSPSTIIGDPQHDNQLAKAVAVAQGRS